MSYARVCICCVALLVSPTSSDRKVASNITGANKHGDDEALAGVVEALGTHSASSSATKAVSSVKRNVVQVVYRDPYQISVYNKLAAVNLFASNELVAPQEVDENEAPAQNRFQDYAKEKFSPAWDRLDQQEEYKLLRFFLDPAAEQVYEAEDTRLEANEKVQEEMEALVQKKIQTKKESGDDILLTDMKDLENQVGKQRDVKNIVAKVNAEPEDLIEQLNDVWFDLKEDFSSKLLEGNVDLLQDFERARDPVTPAVMASTAYKVATEIKTVTDKSCDAEESEVEIKLCKKSSAAEYMARFNEVKHLLEMIKEYKDIGEDRKDDKKKGIVGLRRARSLYDIMEPLLLSCGANGAPRLEGIFKNMVMEAIKKVGKETQETSLDDTFEKKVMPSVEHMVAAICRGYPIMATAFAMKAFGDPELGDGTFSAGQLYYPGLFELFLDSIISIVKNPGIKARNEEVLTKWKLDPLNVREMPYLVWEAMRRYIQTISKKNDVKDGAFLAKEKTGLFKKATESSEYRSKFLELARADWTNVDDFAVQFFKLAVFKGEKRDELDKYELMLQAALLGVSYLELTAAASGVTLKIWVLPEKEGQQAENLPAEVRAEVESSMSGDEEYQSEIGDQMNSQVSNQLDESQDDIEPEDRPNPQVSNQLGSESQGDIESEEDALRPDPQVSNSADELQGEIDEVDQDENDEVVEANEEEKTEKINYTPVQIISAPQGPTIHHHVFHVSSDDITEMPGPSEAWEDPEAGRKHHSALYHAALLEHWLEDVVNMDRSQKWVRMLENKLMMEKNVAFSNSIRTINKLLWEQGRTLQAVQEMFKLYGSGIFTAENFRAAWDKFTASRELPDGLSFEDLKKGKMTDLVFNSIQAWAHTSDLPTFVSNCLGALANAWANKSIKPFDSIKAWNIYVYKNFFWEYPFEYYKATYKASDPVSVKDRNEVSRYMLLAYHQKVAHKEVEKTR
mmetsp:Transcript_2714/g.6182  ORF Transcript_2714/g.6182 Transcript_2714/m.6182 type:complete len:964 (-) Transcript_2714:137-3028(-)